MEQSCDVRAGRVAAAVAAVEAAAAALIDAEDANADSGAGRLRERGAGLLSQVLA